MSLMIDGWMPSVRLVEHQQLRPRQHRAGDGELLLLAAGKIAAAPAHHFGEDGEQAENLVVDEAGGAPLRGKARHQVFAHGEQREDLAPLRHEADAAPRALIGDEAVDILALPR